MFPYVRHPASADTTQWGVVAAGLLFAFPVVWFRIKDSVPLEEDLRFSDETVQDVTVKDIGGSEDKQVGGA